MCQKIYKIENGEVIKGNTSLELVTALRDGSRFAGDESIENYMRNFAYRYKIWSGEDVDFLDVEVFVLDLIRTGFLVEI